VAGQGDMADNRIGSIIGHLMICRWNLDPLSWSNGSATSAGPIPHGAPMRFIVWLSVFTLFPVLVSASQAEEPSVLLIWPGDAPDEPGNLPAEYERMSPALERKQVEVTEPTRLLSSVSKPSITIYRPAADRNTGSALIICPGGGYWNLYWELEGEEVAKWACEQGMTGIILKYRVPRRADDVVGEPARRPLQDAQRALRLVRDRSASLGIRPDRIGMIGFSAGGHLAIATATSFGTQTYEPVDALDKISCRPDFAVAAYPGYLKAKDKDSLAPGIQVPRDTPPVFLVHGTDDIVSDPEHSVQMFMALKRAGISAELHVYASTTHDFGVRGGDRPFATWTKSCLHWMRDQRLLPSIDERRSP